MATGSMSSPEGNSSENLKQVFDSAVGELEDDSSRQRKQPICPRRNGLRLPAIEQDQNRALNDAAEALAALWKTPASKSAFRSNHRRPEHK